jgi:hypothetical protein
VFPKDSFISGVIFYESQVVLDGLVVNSFQKKRIFVEQLVTLQMFEAMIVK